MPRITHDPIVVGLDSIVIMACALTSSATWFTRAAALRYGRRISVVRRVKMGGALGDATQPVQLTRADLESLVEQLTIAEIHSYDEMVKRLDRVADALVNLGIALTHAGFWTALYLSANAWAPPLRTALGCAAASVLATLTARRGIIVRGRALRSAGHGSATDGRRIAGRA